MSKTSSKYGFVECADLVGEQRYGAALKVFQQAVAAFLEAKVSPKRSEIARQLLQIGTVLEETLKKAYGAQWDIHVPKFTEKEKESSCSFCGKGAKEVRKLIAGPSVHICNECVKLCSGIISEELETNTDTGANTKTSTSDSKEDHLCGVCMEPRETDELIFLPHAAYMCAGCLEELQLVRDRRETS